MAGVTIERLPLPVGDRDVRDLARLLVDAVESNASVSFMSPLTLEAAEAWWRETIATARPRAIFVAARDAEGIAGSVQLHPAWAPNQPHRADIAKLIVHRRARGRGLAAAMMHAIERAAASDGFTLLTLDTVRESAADRLYRRLGWTAAGVIPGYALDPSGVMCDTVVFYKAIGTDTVAPRVTA